MAAALAPVRARGLDADGLLSSVGLSPSLLSSPQARVSAEQYGSLWRRIAAALDDEFFAQDSRRMKVGTFAMLCRSVVHCPDLARALERSLRFFALTFDDLAGRLFVDGGTARIVLTDRRGPPPARVFAHETLLMLVHGLACWLVGRRIPIRCAEFSYPAPAHQGEYRLMYSHELRFQMPQTAIAFDAGQLGLPVIQDETSVLEFLAHAPENILVKYKNPHGLGARIRRRLRQSLPDGFPEFDALARELRMAPATLRRRLREEGSAYRTIKDELRRDLAIEQLTHSHRTVLDIALELGFAEPSAFHRAFRKWTGVSPGDFRRAASTAAQQDL